MTSFQEELGALVHKEMLRVTSQSTDLDAFAPLLSDLTNVLGGTIGIASYGSAKLARALCADVTRILPAMAAEKARRFAEESERKPT